jgi:hypothetical protein
MFRIARHEPLVRASTSKSSPSSTIAPIKAVARCCRCQHVHSVPCQAMTGGRGEMLVHEKKKRTGSATPFLLDFRGDFGGNVGFYPSASFFGIAEFVFDACRHFQDH